MRYVVTTFKRSAGSSCLMQWPAAASPDYSLHLRVRINWLANSLLMMPPHSISRRPGRNIAGHFELAH